MVDPHALVSPRAQLGEGVSVGPFAVIGPDVIIGARTTIGAHAVIEGPTRIGEDNKIFAFAAIGGAPQDKKYQGEPTQLAIGDRNVFREFCTMNRGTASGRGITSIGSDCLFMAYAHVAHDCSVGDKVILANCATMGGHVQVGDWVQLGGLSAIHQFCKIGAHAFVAGGAIVTQDLPPYVMIAGNPAVPHAINSEGLKRRGFTPQQIRTLRTAYRLLYRSDLKLKDAVAQLTQLARVNAEVQPLLDFIDASTRGLAR